MRQHHASYGLNRCLEALGLPKSTYYYRLQHSGPSQEDLDLMEHIRTIIGEHPDYGYRRILPELRERTGRRINHKRLRRLLSDYELRLPRSLPKHTPSPVQRTLRQASGSLNLIKGLEEPDVLEVVATDFTELRYDGGKRKAWLMTILDSRSRYVLGWAVGPSANSDLALRCLDQVRQCVDGLGASLAGSIMHHDQDAVYTGYRWLSAVLLDEGMRVSYSERGAKDNPQIESLWGRLKTEIGSRIVEASSLTELRTILAERFDYYNRRRRHSALNNQKPRPYLLRLLNQSSESDMAVAA